MDDFLSKSEAEYIEPYQFAYIYMFIVSLGNPDLKYEIIKPDAIRIGGYGLFY